MMTNGKDKIDLSYYLVAYIDILGQQERLRNLVKLPSKGNQEEISSVVDIMKSTYGAVSLMRSLFEGYFNGLIERQSDVSILNSEQRISFGKMVNNPIKFQRFSDSIIIYMSLRESENNKLQERGIVTAITAAGVTFIGMLARGYAIRGGIDIGIGWEVSDSEFYGPGLARAYALESRIAQYPRIVLGNELINYIELKSRQDETDIYSKASKLFANHCKDYIAIDNDGFPFIDYLGSGFKNLFRDKLDVSIIKEAYDNIIKMSGIFQHQRDSKLAFRYTMLRNYYENRLNLWLEDASKLQK